MTYRLSLRQVRLIFIFASVIIISGISGYRLGVRSVTVSTTNAGGRFNLSLFWDTWDLLHEKFLYQDQLNAQEALFGAVAGLVSSAKDPYTFFLNPAQNERSQEEIAGSFGGIGVHLEYFAEGIGIVAPLNGSPGQEAGVLAGDLIVAVDGTLVGNLSLPEVVDLIRGEPGTMVTLEVLRPGASETVLIPVRRAMIDIPSVEFELILSGCGRADCLPVARLILSRFGDQTSSEWLTAVDQVVAQCPLGACAGVVLDLRNNPGGYLEDSIFVVAEFLENGTVFIQDEGEGQLTPSSIHRRGRLTSWPLVVLVNQGSASASEIVAGALQQHRRAVLVGEPTFGKGTVQEPIDMAGGSGIHITVARWLLPDGQSVEGVGLTPDYAVEEVAENDLDEILNQGLELLFKE